MKYKLVVLFKDKPKCDKCMLSCNSYNFITDENTRYCTATGDRPKCPNEGSRNDCPLVPESKVE